MKQKVLILDKSASAKVLAGSLREINIVPLQAKSSTQAITLLDENLDSIVCVIYDPYLVQSSAMEFLYEMRSYSDMAGVPLICLSSQKLPAAITNSLDWKLFNHAKVFYKSDKALSGVVENIQALVNKNQGTKEVSNL